MQVKADNETGLCSVSKATVMHSLDRDSNPGEMTKEKYAVLDPLEWPKPQRKLSFNSFLPQF